MNNVEEEAYSCPMPLSQSIINFLYPSTSSAVHRLYLDHSFTARRHASAVYAFVVCLSVCLSQMGVLLKQLKVTSRK